MKASDPTRSPQYALASGFDRFVRRFDRKISLENRFPPFAPRVGFDAGPEGRAFYTYTLAVAWFALAFIVQFVAGLGIVLPVALLAGDRPGQVVGYLIIALSFFCIAGLFNALWHRCWHVPRARRARAFGDDSKQYATAMRKTLPGVAILLLQAAVGVLAFLILLNA